MWGHTYVEVKEYCPEKFRFYCWWFQSCLLSEYLYNMLRLWLAIKYKNWPLQIICWMRLIFFQLHLFFFCWINTLYSVFLLSSTLKALMEKRSIWQCLSNYKTLFYLLYKVTWSLYGPLAMFNCRSTSLIQKFLIFSVYADFSLQLCTFTIISFSCKLLKGLFHMCFSHAVGQLLSE